MVRDAIERACALKTMLSSRADCSLKIEERPYYDESRPARRAERLVIAGPFSAYQR